MSAPLPLRFGPCPGLSHAAGRAAPSRWGSKTPANVSASSTSRGWGTRPSVVEGARAAAPLTSAGDRAGGVLVLGSGALALGSGVLAFGGGVLAFGSGAVGSGATAETEMSISPDSDGGGAEREAFAKSPSPAGSNDGG